MRKTFFLLSLLATVITADAQIVASKFRVSFTDKSGSPYSLSNPAAFLSPRAIARRTAQNIGYSQNDLPVNAWYVDSLRNAGAVVLTVSKWFNCATVYTTSSVVYNKISSFPFVAGIDTLAETSLKKGVKPTKRRDSMGGQQSEGTENGNEWYTALLKPEPLPSSKVMDYGLAYTQVSMIATDYLHNLGYRGEGMVIAVLDAGFYNVNSIGIFDSLWANNQILGTKDFVEPGGDVFAKSTHGMMVLSIMGGNSPGQMIGTAPKANYWLLRSEDSDTEYLVEEDNWVCAAEFADSVGADIINSSLGYTEFYDYRQNHTYADMDGNTTRVTLGAEIAASKGILVVNSAGNSGNDPWTYIGAPADADSILAIGAVNGFGVIAGFSSRGPSYDGRVKPEVCAMGEGTYVASTGGTPMPGNGTSFSSPVMAGSAACLWQANPGMNNMQLRHSIIMSAHKYLSPDSLYGYGIPNMAAANLILSGKPIHNFDEENNINVFPNPFQDRIDILFFSADTQWVKVEIFDLSGKSVYLKDKIRREQGYQYFSITGLSGLSKGMYILQLTSGKKVFSTKLSKTE